MFKSIKAWYKKAVEGAEQVAIANEQQGHADDWKMIGEPVKAIIISMRTNPKRWKLRACGLTTREVDSLYKWELDSYVWYDAAGFKLYDKLTGKEFKILMHRGEGLRRFRLFTDIGFSLNAWEMDALVRQGEEHIAAAVERSERAAWRKAELARALSAKRAFEARQKLKGELGL